MVIGCWILDCVVTNCRNIWVWGSVWWLLLLANRAGFSGASGWWHAASPQTSSITQQTSRPADCSAWRGLLLFTSVAVWLELTCALSLPMLTTLWHIVFLWLEIFLLTYLLTCLHQFCLVLLLSSSSSATWCQPSLFLFPYLFSRYYLVTIFLCGLAMSTVVPALPCCHSQRVSKPVSFSFS